MLPKRLADLISEVVTAGTSYLWLEGQTPALPTCLAGRPPGLWTGLGLKPGDVSISCPRLPEGQPGFPLPTVLLFERTISVFWWFRREGAS